MYHFYLVSLYHLYLVSLTLYYEGYYRGRAPSAADILTQLTTITTQPRALRLRLRLRLQTVGHISSRNGSPHGHGTRQASGLLNKPTRINSSPTHHNHDPAAWVPLQTVGHISSRNGSRNGHGTRQASGLLDKPGRMMTCTTVHVYCLILHYMCPLIHS